MLIAIVRLILGFLLFGISIFLIGLVKFSFWFVFLISPCVWFIIPKLALNIVTYGERLNLGVIFRKLAMFFFIININLVIIGLFISKIRHEYGILFMLYYLFSLLMFVSVVTFTLNKKMGIL